MGFGVLSDQRQNRRGIHALSNHSNTVTTTGASRHLTNGRDVLEATLLDLRRQ